MIDEYFLSLSKQILLQSEQVKQAYKSHAPTSGKTKEEIVTAFLNEFVPDIARTVTGLVMSGSGEFGPQSDILVVDHLRGAPLGSKYSNHIWFVESVYAFFEIKSSFSPSELGNAIEKCRKFKQLSRKFDDLATAASDDSLAIIWFFETPTRETTIKTLIEHLNSVPMEQRPDFVISPANLIATTGRYRILSHLGHEKSSWRKSLIEQYGDDLSVPLKGRMEIFWTEGHSLLIFMIWFLSWLVRAGPRRPNLISYLPAQLAGNGYIVP